MTRAVRCGPFPAGVILEARAWSTSYSGHLVETEMVKRMLRVLQSVLMGGAPLRRRSAPRDAEPRFTLHVLNLHAFSLA